MTGHDTKLHSKRDEKKRLLIEQATEIIGRRGLDVITLKQIAQHLKIKQTALLHHFPSKEQLFFKVVESIVQKNNDIVLWEVKKGSKKRQIDAYINGNIKWAMANRSEAGIILYLYYKSSIDPIYKQFYDEIKKSAEERIKGMLKLDQLSFSLNKVKSLHEMLLGGILHLITSKKSPKKFQIESLKTRLSSLLTQDNS